MSSEATATFHSRADAPTTAAVILKVLAENKATVLGQAPDGSSVDFQTKKTMFNWELLGRAVTVSAPAGSEVHLSLDVHHNRPAALMDGMKNKKALDKLVRQLQAALP